MSSSVFYKFKSQKEPSRVEFEGTGISVFELKRDIIIKSGLGDGADFDLAIFNDDATEEYDDDTAVIPRSTSVIARRLPASKRGAGRAQRYVTGKMPVSAKNSARKENSKNGAKSGGVNGISQMNTSMTEDQRVSAMFEALSEQWSGQLEEMAKQTKVHHVSNKKVSEGEPPIGYVCYRCGEKGHWIKECPTNDDPNFENKPRIKRTTGIPRSFLRAVEKPTANIGDGDGVKQTSGIMINSEGQFVIAEPDKKSWEQFQAKTKYSAAAERAASGGDQELQDRGLECPIDKRIFIDPMKTPCCEKTYCNECITNSLIESDFTCPGCLTDGVLLDDLKPDEATSLKIKEYLEQKNASAKEGDGSNSPLVKQKSPSTTEETKIKSPSPELVAPTSSTEGVKLPSNLPADELKSTPSSASHSSTSSSTTHSSNPKKRPAEQILENPKIPKAPKAMQQQQQQQISANLNGFTGIPFNMPFYGMPHMMSGFGAMNNIPLMPVVNPMIMNGYTGFPNMYPGNSGYNSMGSMNMMTGGSMNISGLIQAGNGAANGFPNQQKTIFGEPLPNEEDNAYFRQPVNPHRHQGRQRRARPQDYREL